MAPCKEAFGGWLSVGVWDEVRCGVCGVCESCRMEQTIQLTHGATAYLCARAGGKADCAAGVFVELVLELAPAQSPEAREPVLRWAMAGWKAPPHGWQTVPDYSWDAGYGTWETPFAPVHESASGNARYRLELHFSGGVWTHGKRNVGIVCVPRSSDGLTWWKNIKDQSDLAFDFSELVPLTTNSATSPEDEEQLRAEGQTQLHSRADAEYGVRELLVQMKELMGDERQFSVHKVAEIRCARPDVTSWTTRSERHWTESYFAEREHIAKRSLMHRYGQVSSTLVRQLRNNPDGPDAVQGLAVLFVYLRLTNMRQVVWQHNYNVKPREISGAKLELLNAIRDMALHGSVYPEGYFIVRELMASLGSGVASAQGQRVRDEILYIQSRSGCKGGMMEEWHQRLHNNASADDIIVCEAVLAYARTAPTFDIDVYWDTLHAGGISKERLCSGDRAIRSEPHFSVQQCATLIEDLEAYKKTLKAVFSGADLETAVNHVLGVSLPSVKGNSFSIQPVCLDDIVVMDQQERFARMLRLVLKLLNAKVSDDSSVDDLDFVLSCGNAILECRWSLYEKYLKTPLVSMQHARWNDILLLDLSLEQALKTLLESNGSLAVSDMDATLHLVQLALENSCLSAMPNGEILICARQFNSFAFDAGEWKGTDWALRLHATIQRLYELLGAESIWWCSALGTLSTRLGESLNASDPHVCSMLPEFVVRGTHFASLSQLLPNLGKMVRGLAGLGSWQVVCAGNATSRGVSGIVRVLDELKLVTDEDQIAQEPCILLASTVHGEADIPAQVVAVLTLSTLDILSHIAVRARNERKMLASCCDDAEFAGLQAHAGKRMQVTCRGEGDSVHFEVLA